MDDTLDGRTAQLMKERAKDAENAPVARFARSVENGLLESMAIHAVTEMPKPINERKPSPIQRDPVVTVKDPEQLQPRPVEHQIGHLPQIGGMGPGVITTRKWFLDQQQAQNAHEAEGRGVETVKPTIETTRTPQVTISDLRTIERIPARLLPTGFDDRGRGDD